MDHKRKRNLRKQSLVRSKDSRDRQHNIVQGMARKAEEHILPSQAGDEEPGRVGMDGEEGRGNIAGN